MKGRKEERREERKEGGEQKDTKRRGLHLKTNKKTEIFTITA